MEANVPVQSRMEPFRHVLSPWWKNSIILILIVGFGVLIWLAVRSYSDAPPIPEKVVDPTGAVVFTGEDIRAGQSIFLKRGLMENGTIWGHGAYMGPDFSATYLHNLAISAGQTPAEGYRERITDARVARVKGLLKLNRYDPRTRTLSYTGEEAASFQNQIAVWGDYFASPKTSWGLPAKYIDDPQEIRQLTAFFAWTAWASVASRPGRPHSYTNNFPYDPAAGNTPSSDAILWSALSLIALLGGLALVLFVFGRFNYLGWRSSGEHVHPKMLPGITTDSQRATLKYFAVVSLLFLAQALVGGATAHYRADPGKFFGIDLSTIFPSHIARTWHLQLAIFWIATAYIAGGLLLAPAVGGGEPKRQAFWTNALFGALVVVIAGSLLGEFLGVRGALEKVWFWVGHQGWEYLDLGRAWQILLAGGLVVWLILLFRAIAPARRNPEERETASLFLYAAAAIPLFYLPAMFFDSTTNFTVVDTWRFWIIHLWVEGFFELFVTVMVAMIFFKLGLVHRQTALRVVYLDAILYLGSGIIGTGHHWYWTGQSSITMAFAAVFSAMEVVPLTLLTLDAADFVKLSRSQCDVCGKRVAIPHRWTFYFLMAVGFWNFVGAGIFGFLINLPIVSYFEAGTTLTANHGHAAMMGVFGMLGVALLVFGIRQCLDDRPFARIEKFIRLSFWGLNVGLALMIVTSLFPGGVLQLADAIKNGYWHARSAEFVGSRTMRTLGWIRLPADMIFIWLGIVPIVIATCSAYWWGRKKAA